MAPPTPLPPSKSGGGTVVPARGAGANARVVKSVTDDDLRKMSVVEAAKWLVDHELSTVKDKFSVFTGKQVTGRPLAVLRDLFHKDPFKTLDYLEERLGLSVLESLHLVALLEEE